MFLIMCLDGASVLFSLGEARAALKWADGKILKNEVDLQVYRPTFKDAAFISLNILPVSYLLYFYFIGSAPPGT